MSQNQAIQMRVFSVVIVCLAAFGILSWQYYFQAEPRSHDPLWFVFSLVLAACACGYVFYAMRSLDADKRQLHQAKDMYLEKMQKLERKIQEKEAEAENFSRIFAEFFHAQDVRELGEFVLNVVQKSLQADQSSLMLADREGNLRIVASRGLSGQVASSVHLRLGERVAGICALEKKEFLINGPLNEYPLFSSLEPNPLIRSAIICPVMDGEHVLGVLNISRTLQDSRFGASDVKSAMLLARHVAVALHHARICQELQGKGRELERTRRELEQSRKEIRTMQKMTSRAVA